MHYSLNFDSVFCRELKVSVKILIHNFEAETHYSLVETDIGRSFCCMYAQWLAPPWLHIL